MQPVSTRSDSPGASSISCSVPDACRNARPSPFDALEDESLAAEEAGADALRERDRDVDAARRAEERSPSAR